MWRGEGFARCWPRPTRGRFLGELRLVDSACWRPRIPCSARCRLSTPRPSQRAIDALLRAVLRAIRERPRSIHYQSMSRPDPVRRVIEPHALAHDGFPRCTRALRSRERGIPRFRARTPVEAEAQGPSRSAPKRQCRVARFVALVIAPHPGLTPGQARAIAADYSIRGASTSLRVRAALLFYALKRLGLDACRRAPAARTAHRAAQSRRGEQENERKPADLERMAEFTLRHIQS